MTNKQNVILLKPNQIIRVLKRFGVSVVKTKNSHKLLMNKDGKRTTILSNNNTVISPTLLDRILKDLNIDMMNFINKT